MWFGCSCFLWSIAEVDKQLSYLIVSKALVALVMFLVGIFGACLLSRRVLLFILSGEFLVLGVVFCLSFLFRWGVVFIILCTCVLERVGILVVFLVLVRGRRGVVVQS